MAEFPISNTYGDDAEWGAPGWQNGKIIYSRSGENITYKVYIEFREGYYSNPRKFKLRLTVDGTSVTTSRFVPGSNSYYDIVEITTSTITKTSYNTSASTYSYKVELLSDEATGSGQGGWHVGDVVKSVSGSDLPVPAIMTYAITYDANGGTGAPTEERKTYGLTYTISDTIPTREKYIFQHWNINTSDTGNIYNPGDLYTTNAELILYAIWKKANIPVYVNVAGVIYEVEKAYTNVDNIIKECEVYVNVDGTIQKLE